MLIIPSWNFVSLSDNTYSYQFLKLNLWSVRMALDKVMNKNISRNQIFLQCVAKSYGIDFVHHFYDT